MYAASLSVRASHLQLYITHQNFIKNVSHDLPHPHKRPANSSAGGNLFGKFFEL